MQRLLATVFSWPSMVPAETVLAGHSERYIIYPNLLPWSKEREQRLQDAISKVVGTEAASSVIRGESYTNNQDGWLVKCTSDQAEELRGVEDASNVTSIQPEIPEDLSDDWDIILQSEADHIPWQYLVWPCIVWPEKHHNLSEADIAKVERGINIILGSPGPAPIQKFVSSALGLLFWEPVCTAAQARETAKLEHVAGTDKDVIDPTITYGLRRPLSKSPPNCQQ